MSEANRFGEYIANLRNEKNILLTQLSDGLCDYTLLSRFERGEREPDKLLQNRLLTRLGAVPENYENFLYYKEYCRWEKRQGILHFILEEDMESAKKHLQEYYEEYSMEMPLELQFYLAMKAQICRYEGGGREELAELFQQALQLTVPEVQSRGIENRVLSLEELNLLLEYVYYDDKIKQFIDCETILTYVKQMNGTQLAMAKIYPKVVYYYYLEKKHAAAEQTSEAAHLLELCNEAIELLRNANRMFYLWELFVAKEDLMLRLPKTQQETEPWIQELEQTKTWRITLEEIYAEYGVSIAMYEFCYLYVESENYCIGDVIRIRRKMLGLSQKQLSEGICAERTVSRLERNLTEPQREVVRALFDRLNLSTELNRTELVTDNPAAVEMYRELKRKSNMEDFKQAENILSELRKMVSLKFPSNYQILQRKDVTIKYITGMLSRKEYISEMKDVLANTVSYEKIICSGERYLTNEEIACLQNIALEMNWNDGDMEGCINLLIDLCKKPKYSSCYLRMYQFITVAVTNALGAKGDYDNSDVIEIQLLKLLLRNKRLGGIHTALYELAWNEIQRQGKECCRDKIFLCVQMAMLCKNENKAKEYNDKLKKKEISTSI